MKRIVVVGTTGAGKTTFAATLARALHVPHVEIDLLSWNSNWTRKPVEEFLALINSALAGEAWVVDGNYSHYRPVIWPRADTIIWLDYPLHIIIGRLLWRTMRRLLLQETFFNGNRELLGRTLSRDSIVWWALRTHRHRQRDLTAALGEPRYAHLRQLRFASPREAADWLAQFNK